MKIDKINSIRRRSIIFIICLFVFSVAAGCGSEEQQIGEPGKTGGIGIMIKDKSYIRLDPVLYSTVVAYTAIGEKVDIVGQSKEKTWIGNTSDYWYKIKISGGLAGWTFGANLKLFSENDAGEMKDFLKDLWKKERGRLLDKLTGRWWSVDKYNTFTNQCVEIYNDGKYKAYCTNCPPIEGEYSIKYKKNEIIFSNGTAFGDRVNYLMRGDAYILRKTGDEELKFKRIKRKFDESDAEEKPADKDAKPDKNK